MTTAAYRRAVVAGCARSERSRVTRARYAAVIGAVARISRTDLLLPRTADLGLARTLEALAAGSDPDTAEGAALRATLTRTPKAFAAFVRRNRDWTQKLIAEATAKTTDP